MSKYTKGPWKLHDMEDNTIVGNDHLAIADANAISRSKEENQANAHLIAAAPELLEACKEQMRVIETMGNKTGCWPINDDNLQMAKFAIAKADIKVVK